MSKDRGEAVLFVFRTHMRMPARIPRVYLQGLDPGAKYTVDGFSEVRSGQAWMNIGLLLPLCNFESTVRRIQRV